jgi:hypothetical protein
MGTCFLVDIDFRSFRPPRLRLVCQRALHPPLHSRVEDRMGVLDLPTSTEVETIENSINALGTQYSRITHIPYARLRPRLARNKTTELFPGATIGRSV